MEELLTKILHRLDRIEARLDEISDPEDVMYVKDVAQMIKRSESRVRHLVSAGDIPFHRNEQGGITFSRKEIREWRLGRRILTNSELASQAATHIAISKI